MKVESFGHRNFTSSKIKKKSLKTTLWCKIERFLDVLLY
nr:MAG TPA: hypothetical protein [Caudoviricetes sp.]